MPITIRRLVLILTLLLLPAAPLLAAEGTGEPAANAPLEAEAGSEEEDFGLEEEFEEAAEEEPIDPLSGYNRVMTQVNDRLYFWLIKPVSQGYGAVVPEVARLSINRFFKNLGTPVRFVNNLLQGKFKRAGTELSRFGLNSTIGILGFGDPARSSFDLEAYPEDFGQTLGRYGVGSGFHLVLPLFGPSNLRDAIGRVPDYYLDPINYIEDWEVELAAKSLDTVNRTSLHIGEYESLKKDAVDLYTFMRDSYEQNRVKKIEE